MKKAETKTILSWTLSYLAVFGVCMILFAQTAYAGKSESKNVKVGDTFTVYTTYHSYTQSVLWQWDTGVLELTSTIYTASTSATFRVKQASPSAGVIVQATTYYHQSSTTSTGLNKDVDVFRIYASDSNSGGGDDPNLPTGITVSPSSVSLTVGQTYTLYASLTGGSSTITWMSSCSSDVSVEGHGSYATITALQPGENRIYAVTSNGLEDYCTVNVSSVSPTSIRLPSTATVKVGESTKISATVLPSNASYSLTWTSSDTDYATVSSGTVYGKKAGNVRITATINGSSLSDYCDVTIEPSEQVSNIEGDITGDGLVNDEDYIGIANHILGKTPAGFKEQNADVDKNGVIDVADFIGVANLIKAGSIYGEPFQATVVTNEATSVGESSATLNGSLTVTGATTSYSVGFFIATSDTPSSENYVKKIVNGNNKTGDFSSTVSGLTYSTTYYYCSYILYEEVYYYGETKSFTTTKKTTYAVGDLYPVDNPVGVVFSTSNGGKNGMIASLETTRNYWRGAYNWASTFDSSRYWRLPTKSELQTIASKWSKLSDYIDNGFYWSSTIYSSGVLDTLYWVVTLGSYMGYSNGSSFENSTGSDGWSINTRDALAVTSF